MPLKDARGEFIATDMNSSALSFSIVVAQRVSAGKSIHIQMLLISSK